MQDFSKEGTSKKAIQVKEVLAVIPSLAAGWAKESTFISQISRIFQLSPSQTMLLACQAKDNTKLESNKHRKEKALISICFRTRQIRVMVLSKNTMTTMLIITLKFRTTSSGQPSTSSTTCWNKRRGLRK